jgi:hypothetical protein
MQKIKELFIKFDKWLTALGYKIYPELTKHMKLIFLLFLPTMLIAQTSSDGADISIEYLGTTLDANKPLSKVQVNDTIILALDINNLDSAHDVTYAHIDLMYHTSTFARIGNPIWKTPSNAQNSLFSWTNVGFTPSSNYDVNDMWAQWNHGTYATSSGWNVDHWQSISTTPFGDDTYGHFVELKFKVKDAGSAHDYSKNIYATMARVADNTGSTEYVYPFGEVRAHPVQHISHTPLEDLDSNLYISVDTNDNVDPTKLKVVIKEDGTVVASLPLDGSGDVTVTDYIISSSKTYTMELAYNGSGDDNYKTDWLDNAFTISDVAYLLTETEGGVGHGDAGAVINNGISAYNGDLADPKHELTPQDAYKMLTHVLGTDIFSDSYFDKTFYAVKSSEYDAFAMSKFVNKDTLNVKLVDTLTPDWSQTQNKWEYKTGILGDVNLNYSSAQSQQQEQATITRQTSSEVKKANTKSDVTFESKIEDDKLVVEIKTNDENLSAAQFKVKYDDTKITFNEIIYDTGNLTTNFAFAENGLINLGSINQQGKGIKTESTYKIVFDKPANITSPVGLASIRNYDAANLNGELVILEFK